MGPAGKADAGAVIWSTACLFLLPLLLREGAQALECYSCVQKADNGCSPQKMKTVKCAPGVDVCTEAVGAVETIHGQFSVAVRGCGSGLPGKNDRGLDLHGLLAFIQLQQCAEDRCNAKLNLTSRGLNPAGNESAYEPNGSECYSCVGLSHEKCQGTAPPVVSCYNASDRVYKGCFDGNVTLTAANMTVSLPVRGCVQDESCTRDGVTGPGFTLSGSCCQGSRCNSDLRNKTYFSPRIPPLVLLSPPTTPAPTTHIPSTSVPTSTQAPTAATSTTKPTPAPTSQTTPQEVQPEVSREEGSRLAGGAAGHQDRSNSAQYPPKGDSQHTSNKGTTTLGAGLAALLLAVTAGALV
ncbi:ly6/PLAUR domain-containing protein 3 [Ictidomys tridecemlineatus]|uniref:Ly6/PLAUR domain-containing protein 3 n=1 Tax=Ictidomys tridecemlineatus TaxID=43179 RepID=I3M2K0_ICTTR|nr:ly6/PLAUR domain-containing protein 3 [Ictidomys tridecemlineatus]KAG3256180.1 LY6/PLAUR domain containing 3 [Ictidomys tridecemlineatus]